MEENNGGFNTSNEQIKTKSSKGLLIAIIAIVCAVVAIAYFYLGKAKPRDIFDKQISKITTYNSEKKYDTMKTNMKMNLNIDMKDADKDTKKIIDLINDLELDLTAESKEDAKEAFSNITINKGSKKLVNIDAKLESENNTAYLKLNGLLNKVIKLETESEDADETEEALSLTQIFYATKAKVILDKEIKEAFSDDYFSVTDAEVNGKKVSKNTFSINASNLMDKIATIADKLGENDEFLEAFKDKDEIKDLLDSIVDSAVDMKDEIQNDENAKLEISIYTSGRKQEIEKVDFIATDAETKMSVEITKESEGKYAYKLVSDDEEVISGNVSYTGDESNYTLAVSAESKELGGKLTLNLSGGTTYDEKIDGFDTSNAVSIDDLSEDDQEELLNNIMESDLYKVIMEVYEGIEASSYDSYEDYDFSYDE